MVLFRKLFLLKELCAISPELQMLNQNMVIVPQLIFVLVLTVRILAHVGIALLDRA